MPISKSKLKKITDYLWEIPKNYRSDMKVPARIYTTENMLEEITRDRSLDQIVNVASLPTIEKAALVMPDVHEGYGFPIGGVAATTYPDGIISPGGIGYDINCGIRLLISEKNYDEVRLYLPELGRAIFREVPSGVGRGGRLKLNDDDFNRVLKNGVPEVVKMGYGEQDDHFHIESNGVLPDADPGAVSQRAKDRGRDQLGTMGGGNHFVEVQRVDEIFDKEIAEKLRLSKDQITIMIHTGSRGLGHQVATDYIRVFLNKMGDYGIKTPDRELASIPLSSPEGKAYFSAMSAAANFAWSNRQMITWEVRKAWKNILGDRAGKLDILYDVAHNIAKIEEHEINGGIKKVIVHRKGATRAFGPGHPELLPEHKITGQPVLIPGSMGTASYVLVGTAGSMKETFGSSCHGAGRRMSRSEAKRKVQGRALKEELERRGIVINSGSMSGLAEEAPFAYKDVDEVVDVVHNAGIAKKVARLKPLAVVKG